MPEQLSVVESIAKWKDRKAIMNFQLSVSKLLDIMLTYSTYVSLEGYK